MKGKARIRAAATTILGITAGFAAVIGGYFLLNLEPDTATLSMAVEETGDVFPATNKTGKSAALPKPLPGIDPAPNGSSTGGLPIAKASAGITILQLGDSHTAGDHFSGALRRILQAKYGNGGPGYAVPGRANLGSRNTAFSVSSSPGWTYKALQKNEDPAEFWLSGVNALASGQGQTMSFSTGDPVVFNAIEVEAVRQPGGGAIDIRVDGVVKHRLDLEAADVKPDVVRLVANGPAQARVRNVTITIARPGKVLLSSVAITNRRAGLVYDNIGFVGATVQILNKYDEALFAKGLRRLDPKIVVLAFGSNEGYNSNLDLERYADSYRLAISKIRAALPSVQIAIVAPPAGEWMPQRCRGLAAAACRSGNPPMSRSNPGRTMQLATWGCVWGAPPRLQSVRDVQRDIAQREGLVYWDWSSMMPRECGAHKWGLETPALMAKDHLHLTAAGLPSKR